MTKNDYIIQKREVWYGLQKFQDILEKEARPLSDEERGLYNEGLAKLQELDKTIADMEQMEAIRAAMSEPVKMTDGSTISQGERDFKTDKALKNWMRTGAAGLSAEDRSLLKLTKEGAHEAVELRAVGNLTNGTYIQTTGVMAEIEAAKKYYGGWFEACYNWNTPKGNAMEWPGIDDTSYTGAIEASGTDMFEASDAITLAKKTFNAYPYSSQGVTVTNSDLEDADFPLDVAIGKVLGERLWRAISTAAMVGTGSSQPQGLARAAGKGLFTGNCTITYARLIQFMKKLDYAYANQASSGFMFHQDMMYDIMSLATTTGQPLWLPSLAAGQPATFMGKKYWVSNELTAPSTVAALSRHMLFGDFSKFVLRFAGPTMLVRLTERYAELYRTGFIAIQRFDSELLAMNATTYNPVKYLRRLGT